MRTAITMGLLALTATVAATSVIATPTIHAQSAETTEFYEQPSPEGAFAEPVIPEATGGEATAPDSQEVASPGNQVDLGTFMTTSYSLNGVMKGGDWTYYGAVAVDPSVIPLGSTIYIEDLGYFVAEDTGSAVRGDHIDIWLPTRYEALSYGVQYRRAWLVG